MQLFNHPVRSEWPSLLQRPYVDNRTVLTTVQAILDTVQRDGDKALKSYAKEFDHVVINELEVSDRELEEAGNKITDKLKKAIQQAGKNIELFHSKQLSTHEIIETMPGVKCWRKNVPIEKVGLYIPGGTAPLFSTVLMLGVPALLAGCKEVILCTPGNKDGMINPAILYAASLVGLKRIFKTGGAQAIAAMAYGTESIPSVFKIFGPGNQYVTAAKQLIQMHGIAIDMPAGPSEVCVLADETAVPSFVAADLLSQAEHGPDSQVLLVSTSAAIINDCTKEIEKQINLLPRKDIAHKALENSKAILSRSIEEAIELVNEYAAEHLIISCKDADMIADKITNAGSVFIGNYSPESAGDYASGTNHTLPTNGFAKVYSGVSVDSFMKKITYQKLSAEGLGHIASTIIEMAEEEGLRAHAEAVRVRKVES
jgi:histidinol dehydrogenase